MSLATWKAEFYPTDAEEHRIHVDDPVTPAETRAAIEHSLVKWAGLLPENLERHSVTLVQPSWGGWYVSDEGGSGILPSPGDPSLSISSDSCALCTIFVDRPRYEGETPSPDRESIHDDRCGGCPLVKARGGFACDERGDEPESPWSVFSDRRDPKSMLALLEQAKKENL